MKIFTAQVVDNTDNKKTNLIECSIEIATDSNEKKMFTVPVVYTSPFHSNNGPENSTIKGAGFSAPIEVGDRVLVCLPENENRLYYMSTIVETRPHGNRESYSTEGDRLTSTGMSNAEGAALELTTEIGDSVTKMVAELRGHGGSGSVMITNNPEAEAVNIEAPGKESSIKLTGPFNFQSGGNKIQMDAKSNTVIRTRMGSTLIDTGLLGGMISLVNNAMFPNPLRITTPFAAFTGDIKIDSENNCIDIRSCTDPTTLPLQSPLGPGITLTAGTPGVPNPLAEIGLNSAGKVVIYAATGIDIVTPVGDINIQALTGCVNIKGAPAPPPLGGVNLQPTTPTTVEPLIPLMPLSFKRGTLPT